MAKIIIVEDDPFIAKSVKSWLENEKHTVDVVADGSEGLFLLQNYSYDLAIIDWQLPGMQGAEICLALRSSGNTLPVLMLTSRSALSDRVQGLDSGAYDYMVKPASLEELSARVRALLRRPVEESQERITLGNLAIDIAAREARINGERAALTPNEFAVLLFLCKNLDESFGTDILLSRLWADKPNVSSSLVRVHITHLRQKLADLNSEVQIVSHKRTGYKATIANSENS